MSVPIGIPQLSRAATFSLLPTKVPVSVYAGPRAPALSILLVKDWMRDLIKARYPHRVWSSRRGSGPSSPEQFRNLAALIEALRYRGGITKLQMYTRVHTSICVMRTARAPSSLIGRYSKRPRPSSCRRLIGDARGPADLSPQARRGITHDSSPSSGSGRDGSGSVRRLCCLLCRPRVLSIIPVNFSAAPATASSKVAA